MSLGGEIRGLGGGDPRAPPPLYETLLIDAVRGNSTAVDKKESSMEEFIKRGCGCNFS